MMKSARGESISDPNAEAHTICMAKKMGYLDEHGKVNKEHVKGALSRFIKDDAKLKETITECAVDKDTPYETARHLWKCVREHGPPPPPRPQHH